MQHRHSAVHGRRPGGGYARRDRADAHGLRTRDPDRRYHRQTAVERAVAFLTRIMARYLKEPPYTHGTAAKCGVLLINLGTPDAPTARAVRRYLREFLSDPRVVEIPRAIWWIILNLFILPFRPKESARRYAQVWTPDGSPLRMHTEKQARMLRGYLGERIRAPLVVDYAMRYGTPSIPSVIDKMKQQG